MRKAWIVALVATAALVWCLALEGRGPLETGGGDRGQESWKDIAEKDLWWTPTAEQKEAAEQAKVAVAAKNGVGMDFALIPAGTFTMGSPESEAGRDEDESPHEVTLTRSYYMARTEVTQAQWEAVMGTKPSYFKNAGNEAPVEQVSWQDAVDFCNMLSERDGFTKAHKADGSLDPKANGYRLPTEAEWEYACRAGTKGDYHGRKLEDIAWFGENAAATYSGAMSSKDFIWLSGEEPATLGTQPVGQKEANSWGLYDMHGNVGEWCADWYAAYAKGAATDPIGPDSGQERVVRGGSWGFNARLCRSANRDWNEPGRRFIVLGFRPSRSP